MTPENHAAERARHPKGLYVLFFTELWERFGFYTLMALLTLYLDEYFHLQNKGSAYGIFLGFIYFMPIVGGFVADRLLGFRKTIAIGAVILAAGYAVLAVPIAEDPAHEARVQAAETDFQTRRQAFEVRRQTLALHSAQSVAPTPDAKPEPAPRYDGPERCARLPLFLIALVLLVAGNALFKPNISVLVGNLYPAKSPLKDAAFNIFYMGINLGSLLAYVSATALRNALGWSAAFAAAAAGMGLALVIFLLFGRHVKPAEATAAASTSAEQPTNGRDDRRRIGALVIVFAIAIVFWMSFFQNGFTLTLWARDNTSPLLGWQIPPELFGAFNPLFIVGLTPLLVWFWAVRRRRGREPSTSAKIALGMLVTALAFGTMALAGWLGGDQGRVSPLWLAGSYFTLTIGEIMLSPMGLSLVSKVAPPRMRGLMMGGWFVALAAGGYLAGLLEAPWQQWPHSLFFLFIVGLIVLASILLQLVRKRLSVVFDRQ